MQAISSVLLSRSLFNKWTDHNFALHTSLWSFMLRQEQIASCTRVPARCQIDGEDEAEKLFGTVSDDFWWFLVDTWGFNPAE